MKQSVVKNDPVSAEKEETISKSMAPPAFSLDASDGGERKIFRGMTDEGGVPAIGETKRKLGVTMPDDLDVDSQGIAKHNEKGMSTSPDSPTNLPPHRRNAEWGGTGKDPVWKIDLSKLNTSVLEWHEDNPGKHGIVRPKTDMPYDTFKSALNATQSSWERATK